MYSPAAPADGFWLRGFFLGGFSLVSAPGLEPKEPTPLGPGLYSEYKGLARRRIGSLLQVSRVLRRRALAGRRPFFPPLFTQRRSKRVLASLHSPGPVPLRILWT